MSLFASLRAFGFLLVGAFAAFSAQAGEASESVYVVSHGLHSGILVPNPAQSAESSFWPAVYSDAAWLEIGWGDGKYYPDANPGLLLGLRALMVPTASVLHVVAIHRTPLDYFPPEKIVTLQLSPEQLVRLAQGIAAEFVLDANGMPRDRGPGLYGESRFFEARGEFHLFNNCNHWVAARLEDAGLEISVSGALTGDGLLEILRDRFAQDKRGTDDD